MAKRFRLLDLPGELHNAVYRYTVFDDRVKREAQR
jgi:hypothetical protein